MDFKSVINDVNANQIVSCGHMFIKIFSGRTRKYHNKKINIFNNNNEYC